MVLTSDSYPSVGYQQTYVVTQEGYGYPQTGNSYATPIGTGYSSVPFSNHQYQNLPMGEVYNHSHGHGNGHGQGHEHNHGHKYQQHAMTTYSAGDLGLAANQCPPMGHGYGPSYISGTGKYGKIYTFKEADD